MIGKIKAVKLLIYGFVFLFVLQTAFISLPTGKLMFFSLPSAIFIFLITLKDIPKGTNYLIFLVFVSGFMSNLLSAAPVISFIFMPVSFWMAGYLLNLNRDKLSLFLNKASYAVLAVLFILLVSEIYAFSIYSNIIPDWGKPVVYLMEGRAVPLKNAFGWIIWGWSSWSAGLMFFLFSIDYIKRYGIRGDLAKYAVAGALITVLFGLFQMFVNSEFALNANFRGSNRINSIFYDPNVLAYSMFIVFAILCSFSLDNILNINKYLKYFMFSGILLVIAASGSRSIILGLFILFIFLIYKTKNRVWAVIRKNWVYSIIACVMMIILMLISQDTGINRISKTFLDIKKSNATYFEKINDRIPYWKTGLGIFNRNIWGGTGVGRYLIVLPDHLRSLDEIEIHNTNESSCSLYIQFAAETGIFGFLSLICVLLIAAREAFVKLKSRVLTESVSAAVYLIFLVLFNFSMHILYPEIGMFFWFLAAVVVSGNFSYDKKSLIPSRT